MVQSFNLDATLYSAAAYFNKSLLMPHFLVKDISKIDFELLKELGFEGLIFDKDNTLTAPYVNEIHPTIRDAFEHCRSVFGEKIAIMSNSAGTNDDKRYEDARKIEKDLGIAVLRHARKKPSGFNAVRNYFRHIPFSNLVMFGDRILTDVAFGNRYGMLTVYTALLTEEGDNKAAAKIRKYELPLVKKLIEKGVKAPHHKKYDSRICLESLI